MCPAFLLRLSTAAAVIAAELDHAPLEVVWTHRGTRLRETRGITPVATIVRRR
jgi:hypothetical protein